MPCILLILAYGRVRQEPGRGGGRGGGRLGMFRFAMHPTDTGLW